MADDADNTDNSPADNMLGGILTGLPPTSYTDSATNPVTSGFAASPLSPANALGDNVPAAAPPPAQNPLLSGLNTQARGMRNNNPGNLEANAYTSAMPGYVGTDGRFAKFATPQQGIDALKRNLSSYAAKGISTPLEVASTWAPASEAGNDPNSYGGMIANELGVKPGDKIDLTDPTVQDKVAKAIVKVENGAGNSTGGGGETNSGGSRTPLQTNPAAPPSGLMQQPDQLRGLMQLALLKAAFPQHQFTPIDYDPYKVMPHYGGGAE